MNNFVVALWNVITGQSKYHCEKSLDLKMKEMKDALKMCQQKVLSRGTEVSTSNEFQAIFLAPEYYFIGPCEVRMVMNEDQKTSLELSIRSWSKLYPRILIVPGSVHYEKTMIRPVGSLKLDHKTGELAVVGPDRVPKDRRGKALAQLWNAMSRDGRDDRSRFAVTQEAFNKSPYWNTKGPTGLPLPVMTTKLHALKDRSAYIIRNATYLYLDGVRHAKYDKQLDWNESVWAPDDAVFVPGTRDQCPVIGKHRFGVEICADHAVGSLTRRNPGGLHFHLVMSDAIDAVLAHMAMGNGGYFLHASSRYTENCVYYRDSFGSIRCLEKPPKDGYINEESCGGGELHYYSLPLPPTIV